MEPCTATHGHGVRAALLAFKLAAVAIRESIGCQNFSSANVFRYPTKA